MYRGLVSHTRRVLLGYYDLVRVCKGMSYPQRMRLQSRGVNKDSVGRGGG